MPSTSYKDRLAQATQAHLEAAAARDKWELVANQRHQAIVQLYHTVSTIVRRAGSLTPVGDHTVTQLKASGTIEPLPGKGALMLVETRKVLLWLEHEMTEVRTSLQVLCSEGEALDAAIVQAGKTQLPPDEEGIEDLLQWHFEEGEQGIPPMASSAELVEHLPPSPVSLLRSDKEASDDEDDSTDEESESETEEQPHK